MSQYLLLRDNKQSGPYTFEELTAKGLKGYDLIWIEGKSAAWRYPSEIQEFKAIAPVVEEQPYDRFYKRQTSTANKQSEVSASVARVSSTPLQPLSQSFTAISAESHPKQNSDQAPTVNRRVVVILPGGMKDTRQERVMFNETIENTIAQPEEKVVKREQVSSKLQEIVPVKVEPSQIDFKKEPAGRIYKKQDNGFLFTKTPKIIAATFILLTIGVLIGWAFSNNFVWDKPEETVVTPKEIVDIPASQSVFNNEGSSSMETQVSADEQELAEQELFLNASQVGADSTAMAVPSETTLLKKPVAKVKKQAAVSNIPTSTLPVTQPMEAVKSESIISNTDADEAEKKSVKKNINELIRVGKNDFKVGAFGGISNLKLKVTNNSPYPVDLVVVEVKYLLANKKEFKTENIYFKNLAAGASNTIEVPKSSRGIEVSTKVALITSKALGMYQASL